MIARRLLNRAALVALMAAAPALWYACADGAPDPAGPAGPPAIALPVPDLGLAIAAQRRHTEALLAIPGVVGTAVAALPDGRAGMLVLVERAGVGGLPASLDGIPVSSRVTGRIMAYSDPTQRQRPAPTGFSVGHPAITAGTIGARVRDALGRVYILSNNHVLANQNNAAIGDPQYQPGPFDGGTAADQIATLADFQPITFTSTASNTMDAAIALSTITLLDNATPADDGYGMPNATIYGDADGDGQFDDRNALLGLTVQKYGRTTRLTHGQITGVNATVTVCYAVSGLTCTKSARFVDQLLISPGAFSNGGDSGSLIVTDDPNRNPVGLLFAGSSTVTIANRIDLVLARFGVTIDGNATPPGPFTDVAVTSVSAPPAVIVGQVANIGVTVVNVGNQDVATSFDVTLYDSTAGVSVGTQTVAGLGAGAGTTLTFTWSSAGGPLGEHALVARHTLTDDHAGNNARARVVTVNPVPTDIALTGITAPRSVYQGDTAHVVVSVRNAGQTDVTDAFAVVLTDGSAGGVTVGTGTVPGLAVGATTTVDIPWHTAGAALNVHILIAQQMLADAVPTNNSIAIAVTVNPVPITDLAVTGLTAPASVTQGSTASVGVTVSNVGGLSVGTSFDVVLTDATAGVTIGTQTLAGLPAGATTTRTFNWNTTGAALGGHTLVAFHSLVDANAGNNQRSATVTLSPPLTDVAVTFVSAPGTVYQGNNASIGVTLANVGGVNVGTAFSLVLTDVTAGVTIGTQTVSGLAVGATTTRSFSWNTTGAALGGHTLVVSHTVTDDNAANNQRSATVTVAPKPNDLALTSITAPSRVTVGDTAPVVVTVQNVGGQDVTASFNVVLTDGSAGNATIGTQTIPGLAVGASATRTFSWRTTGVATGGHILIATQKLADANASNNSRAVMVTVDPPSLHVGNLGGAAESNGATWTATVQVTAHDVKHNPVNGVVVRGIWNGSSADASECTTGADGAAGTCTIVRGGIPAATASMTFAVTGMTLSGSVYKASANHDPDGSSNGFSITVKRP